MYSEQSNQNLVFGWRDNPGFGCIQSVATVDYNMVKRAYRIHFVPPPFAWFKHPKPDPISRHVLQRKPDEFGLWDVSTKGLPPIGFLFPRSRLLRTLRSISLLALLQFALTRT